MWTAGSFSYYTMQYITKYIEGNLFLNYYLDATATLVGISIAQPLYRWLKMKYTFILSLSFTVVLLVFLLLFQEHYLSTVHREDSPYPEGSKEDQDLNLRTLIPILAFLSKVFINITFLNVYQCSFNEDLIFPFYKRTTSVGITNFVGRIFTIASPQVAELSRPLPCIILISLNSLAIIAAFFFPSRQDEIDFNKKYVRNKQE